MYHIIPMLVFVFRVCIPLSLSLSLLAHLSIDNNNMHIISLPGLGRRHCDHVTDDDIKDVDDTKWRTARRPLNAGVFGWYSDLKSLIVIFHFMADVRLFVVYGCLM